MKKILFLIHDLGHGGAEKVLVNLVNNMDREKFDITVMALFGGGVNEQFLGEHIKYKVVHKKAFPGNSRFMKLLSPEKLHKRCIKETYDIEVAYLEGPSARIISGCPNNNTKLISWTHCTMHTETEFAKTFRNLLEALSCYKKFDNNVFVSGDTKESFEKICKLKNACVLYNTNDSNAILSFSKEAILKDIIKQDEFNIIAVGKVEEVKGFERLAHIYKRLRREGYIVHVYILGKGTQQEIIEKYLADNGIADGYSFLGYQTNPYKYVSKCDLFVCSSFSEGFSTAATEALIVGTPVCTVEVSGMKEMLGENNEYGIVTDNNEEALYQGIKCLLDNPKLLEHYREKAAERGKMFSTENTVCAVEEMLLSL